MNLEVFHDPDGVLVPIEFNNISFTPSRIFYVTDVPMLSERGNHAHKNNEQYLVCLKGKILVKLHNGYDNKEVFLEENESIFVDKMVWDSQIFLTGEDVMLAICSDPYDKADYIEDFDEFVRLATGVKP